jgi:hypothetical protein
LKAARERGDIVVAYAELGSDRAAAALCGTTHKTVRHVVERCREGGAGSRPLRVHNTDSVQTLIAERIRSSDGRISARRLVPVARAAGYSGSARNLRRNRRVYQPWIAKRASTG